MSDRLFSGPWWEGLSAGASIDIRRPNPYRGWRAELFEMGYADGRLVWLRRIRNEPAPDSVCRMGSAQLGCDWRPY